MADNVYYSQRGNKFKADVVGGVAIPGFKLVTGADDTDGGYITSFDGKIGVISYPYLEQIREGLIANHVYKKIKGHCHNIGITDQTLSALGTAGFGNWPAAAAGAVLVSTDVNDDGDPASTGARTVIVRGLDSNWDLATATVTMNGTTPTAATAQTFIRINELEVVTAGTSLSNEGTITASISGANIMAIYPTHTTSEAGRYTIPAGYIGYFQNPEGSGVGNKEITYHIFCRDTTVANSPFKLLLSWHSNEGGYRPNGNLHAITQKSDIVIVVHAVITGAIASASLEGWIEL